MNPNTFAATFAANVDANDVSEEAPQDLLLRARNTVDVLRLHGTSPVSIRQAIADVLSSWGQAQLEPFIKDSNVDWFATPQLEQLLRSLFQEMVQYAAELPADPIPASPPDHR